MVYDRLSGKIVRVINPTFEEELELHSMTSDEFMLKVDKAKMGISLRADAMTRDDLARVVEAMS